MNKLRNIFATTFMMLLMHGTAQAAEYEVKMLNNGAEGSMVFEPGYLKVAPGDTVKFVPTSAGHDSVSVTIPKGAKGWQGKTGQAVSVTLDKEGVYIYKCSPHTIMAMVGVIQVGKASNLDEAKSAAKELSATFALNKDRLNQYMAQVK